MNYRLTSPIQSAAEYGECKNGVGWRAAGVNPPVELRLTPPIRSAAEYGECKNGVGWRAAGVNPPVELRLTSPIQSAAEYGGYQYANVECENEVIRLFTGGFTPAARL